jgi:arylsulfatase A
MLMFLTRAWIFVSSFGAFAIGAMHEGSPNIILINVDDLGYADISPFGGRTPTPNLERMAKEGVKLMSHYAAPVCSPSRAAMMTGCYPKRVLPIPGVLFPAAAVGLNPAEQTIAEVLRANGYSTACIGKWHLGDQPEFLPMAQGFDHYYGIPYSNDMGKGSEGSKSNPGSPLPKGNSQKQAAQKPPPSDGTGLRGEMQPPLPLLEDSAVVERVKIAEQHSFTRRYTERAVKYMREHQQKPFFLYLPHNAVHFPHYPNEDFIGKSGRGLLNDWVMEVDESTGQIFAALREMKLDKKTLVIFTSDNGGPLNYQSDNAPLRGGKGSTFEGGIRVCTIAWWPGKIPSGSQTHAITSHMDWLPTFAAMCSAKISNERKIDGKDMSALLFGRANASGHNVFYYYSGFNLQAVRSGPWKLHLEKNELYHLESDIGETVNVSFENPDIVAKMRREASEMIADLGDKTADAPGVRPLGRVDNPSPLISEDGTVREGFNKRHKVLP